MQKSDFLHITMEVRTFLVRTWGSGSKGCKSERVVIFLSYIKRTKCFSWQDVILYCLKKVKGLNKASAALCKPLTNLLFLPSQRFPSGPKVLATVRHAGSTRPQDAMNMWIEELREDHFRICIREVKTFDGKHQNLQVVSFFLYANAHVTPTSIRTWSLYTQPLSLSHCQNKLFIAV